MNAEAPIVVRDGEKVTERRFVHVPFAPNWSVIVMILLSDMSNEPDRFVHPENAFEPKNKRLIGEKRRTPVPEQLKNADPLILVIEDGKDVVSLLQFLKD